MRQQLLKLQQFKGKYENATLAELNEGYKIYKGTCTDCHRAKNIYKRSDTKWPEIIRVMSKKAKISAHSKRKIN